MLLLYQLGKDSGGGGGGGGAALHHHALSPCCKLRQPAMCDRSPTLMACLAPAMFLSLSSETASWHRAILTCRAVNIFG